MEREAVYSKAGPEKKWNGNKMRFQNCLEDKWLSVVQLIFSVEQQHAQEEADVSPP